MKDKNGKQIVAGSYLLCINDEHCGETVCVEKAGSRLAIPCCDGISCNIPLSALRSKDEMLTDYIVIDDPTKKIGYTKAIQIYKNLDLTKIADYREIHPDNLNNIQIAKLRSMGYETLYPGGDESIYVGEIDVIAAECDMVDYEYIDIYDPYYDDTFEDLLSLLIRDADHYLVFASGCRWDGSSGYKFASSRHETVYRPYDTTIMPVAVSPNGKTLVCRESSHDVPMGSTTIIVALTEKEFERLENAKSFETIRKFAEKQEQIARKYQEIS